MERKLNLFCHLGYHKTGSTHLQMEVFTKLEKTLLVTRPHTELYDAFNSLKYSIESDYSDAQLQTLLAKLLSEEKTKNSILVSDERLLGAPNRNYLNRKQIMNRLASFEPEAHAIVFLRGQLDLVESLYNQYVKTGQFLGEFGPEFIALNGKGINPDERNQFKFVRQIEKHHCFYSISSWMDVSRFKYSTLIRDLHCNFKHVHIFLYEDLLNDPKAVYARLSELLDEESIASIIPKTKKANLRLKEDDLWFELVKVRIREYFPAINRYPRWILAKLYVFCFGKGFQKRKKAHLDLLRDNAGFGKDNEIVNRKYGLGMEKYPGKYLLKEE